MPRVTQVQIARRLGITQQAVGYALSARPQLTAKLAATTRRRVLETAAAMGYVPDHAARRLVRNRHSARTARGFDQVGVIYLPPGAGQVDPICLEMMGAADHEMAGHNASLLFVRVNPGEAGQSAGWEKVDRIARSGGVDGWLLYGGVTDEVIDRIAGASPLPYVILGDHRCKRATAVNNVNVDNAAVARLAVEHLARLGHRHVAFFGSTTEYVYQRQIREGFSAAVRALGLDDDPVLISDPDWLVRVRSAVAHLPDAAMQFRTGIVQYEQMVSAWLREIRHRATAIVAPEFGMMPGTLNFLRSANIDVPANMSFVGVEQAPAGASSDHRHSRVEVSMSEVGREGARLLHRVATGGQPAAAQLLVAPTFVEGWTSAKPKTQRN
jgi:DNA-binding LacI/PurR family transcriptional regulator